jgi:hypothetical protein
MSNTTIDLESPYIPAAIYLDESDMIEYVRSDTACFYRRVDGFLTVAYSTKTRELVGFRVKGFKNFFLKYLQPKYKLIDADFIPLVGVIEQALEVVGDEVTHDPPRRDAYRKVLRMAHDDRVEIQPLAA